MDDLISRRAAIDAIHNADTQIYEGKAAVGRRNYMTKEEVCSIIDSLPSAQPEQRWIPCSERLPERNGRYLVTRGLNACGSLWNRVYMANYSDLMGLKKEKIWWDGNVGKSDFVKLDDIIAWMPLPELYRKDGD